LSALFYIALGQLSEVKHFVSYF